MRILDFRGLPVPPDGPLLAVVLSGIHSSAYNCRDLVIPSQIRIFSIQLHLQPHFSRTSLFFPQKDFKPPPEARLASLRRLTARRNWPRAGVPPPPAVTAIPHPQSIEASWP